MGSKLLGCGSEAKEGLIIGDIYHPLMGFSSASDTLRKDVISVIAQEPFKDSIIEVGFPAASNADLEAVKAIAMEVGNDVDENGYVPVICGLSRCNKGDIDAAWEAVKYAKRPRIHTFTATSEIHMMHKLNKTREEIVEIARSMVKYARSLGCEVEVEEIELVVFPFCNVESHNVAGEHESNEGSHVLGKDEPDMVYKTSASSVGVHEGVQTIAKMVKGLLTSFHIKIKNVIVAIDPCVDNDEEKEGSHETLALRVKQIECGTCIFEERYSTDDAKAYDFLGLSHLTNFLKFEEAIFELLQMNGEDNETIPLSGRVTASCCFPLNASKPLLIGERGGFSGSMKLSIPWKNGSLDVRKVDAGRSDWELLYHILGEVIKAKANQDKEWADLQAVARALWFELIAADGNTVIWKKPSRGACFELLLMLPDGLILLIWVYDPGGCDMGKSVKDSTWEFFYDLLQKYPHFNP